MLPGPRSQRLAAVLTLLACLGLAEVATADRDRARASLEFSAPAGAERCPSEAAIRRAVAARLGYGPFTPNARRKVVATINAASGVGLVGLVELRGEDGRVRGRRRLVSPTGDCAELAASLELAIAIAIDPLVMTRPGSAPPDSRQPSPPPPRPARPAPAPPARRVVARPPSSSPPLQLHAGGGLLLGIGVLPAARPGFTVALGVRRGALSLGLEGRADLPATKAASGGEVEASLLAGSVVPCWHRGVLGACGLVTLGALRGRGVHLDQTAQRTSLFAAVGARLAVKLPLARRIALRLHADPVAVLSRTTLRVNEADVWSSPPVAIGVGAALIGEIL